MALSGGTNLEAGRRGDGLVEHLDHGDDGMARPFVAGRDQRIDDVWMSLQRGFDATVATVRNPTIEPHSLRSRLKPGPVTHALHAPLDAEAHGFSRMVSRLRHDL